MPTYGSTYQVYGSQTCGHCGSAHMRFLHVKETRRSRFKLMQFCAEMTARHQNGGIHTHTIGRGQRFMVGLLISGNTTLVAASGNNNNKLTAAAQGLGYTVCPRITTAVGHRSRMGRVIPQAEYAGAAVAGDPTPGNCAAPRLIQHAFTTGARGNWRHWEMSEIYYEPNTSARTDRNSHWVHGLSAHSCGTCENLVPLLLCPLR